jgi:hypothetical protein
MDMSQLNIFDSVKKNIKPSECRQVGKYIFETTPESKGDYIRREIDIIDRGGKLGVFFNASGNFVRVDEFRNDCTITLI